MNERIAICPGSFDCITLGHLDIITRASAMFDKVIVVAMNNENKQYTFTPQERIDMIKKSTNGLLGGVEIGIAKVLEVSIDGPSQAVHHERVAAAVSLVIL